MSIPAPEQEERRGDTVALPRSTYKAATWILTSVLGFGTFALWNSHDKVDALVIHLEYMESRVSKLESFGPGRGERFTAADAKDMQREIKVDLREANAASLRRHIEQGEALKRLTDSVAIHHDSGAHSDAGRRLTRLERRMDKLDGGN